NMPIIQNPKPLTLSELLGQSRLEIPTYQRSYSWTDVQVDEYLGDLFESFRSGESWFLGILYTYPKPGSALAALTMLLDGQQRITTTFILLKELMLFFENLDE